MLYFTIIKTYTFNFPDLRYHNWSWRTWGTPAAIRGFPFYRAKKIDYLVFPEGSRMIIYIKNYSVSKVRYYRKLIMITLWVFLILNDCLSMNL